MHLVNQGQLAAALILAGVSLPAEFNLEESVIARKEEELRGTHPKLDKVALDLLAQVATAKDLAAELDSKRQEFEAGLPAGASAAEVAAYKAAHTAKTNAVLGEIASLKQDVIKKKAEDDAEAAVLKKHGLMRNDKGELVPFKEEAELKAELEPETPENVEKPIGISKGTAEPEPSDVVLGTGADAKPEAVAKGGGLEPEPEAKQEAKQEESQGAPDPDKKPSIN